MFLETLLVLVHMLLVLLLLPVHLLLDGVECYYLLSLIYGLILHDIEDMCMLLLLCHISMLLLLDDYVLRAYVECDGCL